MVTSHEPDKSPVSKTASSSVIEAPASAGPPARVPLRLKLSSDLGHGRLHGAWWPQSRDLDTELTDLVSGFPEVFGRVIRAVYSRPDWVLAPRKVAVDDAVIKVGSFPHDDTHLVILTLSTRNLSLLVVPPDTSERQAADAMNTASSPSNQASARDILDAHTPTISAGSAEHWDDSGAPWWAPHPVPPSYRVPSRPARTRPRSASAADRPASRPSIAFRDEHGVYTGRSESGRMWRISPELTGWRLEFRDAGDRIATNAGLHRSVEAAIAEASR